MTAGAERGWALRAVADAEGSESGVSPDQLRAGMAHFASGVTVVTTVLAGTRHAMTATAFTSVSLQPPLVLVCVGRRSRFHPAVLAAGRWAVSVLSADQRWIADHFARNGRELSTQFDGVDHDPAPFSGAPVLHGAQTWLDCRTWAVQEAGDHTIVVGLVLAVGDFAAVGDASPGTGSRPPLTYHRGSYQGL
ncbi:MAG: flavin reductase family protein [Propionibacteriaceae bacterium]